MVRCFWFLFILLLLRVGNGSCDDQKYRAGFTAGTESCFGFDNDKFNCDGMKLAPMYTDDEDGAGSMCIEGYLELHKGIEEGMMINVDIEKETDAGSEPMFTIAMDMCESLDDDDAPWKPLFTAMGIEKCPIEAGKYAVSNMTLDLGFCKDMLNHNYVGDYTCSIKMADQQRNAMSCHTLGLCIIEE